MLGGKDGKGSSALVQEILDLQPEELSNHVEINEESNCGEKKIKILAKKKKKLS